MNNLKRCFFAVWAVFMVWCAAWGAAAENEMVADHEAIEEAYQEAMAATKKSDVVDCLNRLIGYYEQTPSRKASLDKFGFARYYLWYAKGRVAFEEGDFDTAYEYFNDIVNAPEVTFLEDARFFYCFSLCEEYIALEEYENALDRLAEARGAMPVDENYQYNYSAKCNDEHNKIKEIMVQKAQEACSKGNHEKAQAIYAVYRDKINAVKGQRYINECIEHSSKPTWEEETYQAGMKWVEDGDYARALTCFEQIPKYSDSKQWQTYCQALLEIGQANELEMTGDLDIAEKHIQEARECFRQLEKNGFKEASDLMLYCDARRYELHGMRQPAIDIYSELYGVLDSRERPKPLPTQVPRMRIPDRLPRVPAHAARTIKVYAGPGTDYEEIRTVRVTSSDQLWICGKKDSWFLLEVQTDGKLMRVWASAIRVERDAEEPVEPQIKSKEKRVMPQKNTQAYWGPGEEYEAYGTVLKGTRAVLILEEDIYSMIEIKSNESDAMIIVWVRTEDLM